MFGVYAGITQFLNRKPTYSWKTNKYVNSIKYLNSELFVTYLKKDIDQISDTRKKNCLFECLCYNLCTSVEKVISLRELRA